MKNSLRRILKRSTRWLLENTTDSLDGEHQRLTTSAYSELNCKLLALSKEQAKPFRPSYAWGVLQAAHLARTLGFKAISVAEFGCAAGNGLLALEETATRVEKMLGISIHVFGFDTGGGLPPPTDYRDMPNTYQASDYAMDVGQLKQRLRRTNLRIGLIGETLSAFIAQQPAPVGFISIDVDLYTSTVDTLTLLKADPAILLPRVHCYFDDILGFTCADFLGERLAIAEFNASHAARKLSPIYGLGHYVPRRFRHEPWTEKFFLAHILDHPLYCAPDGLVRNRQRALEAGIPKPGT
jgi:hypothetical protein